MYILRPHKIHQCVQKCHFSLTHSKEKKKKKKRKGGGRMPTPFNPLIGQMMLFISFEIDNIELVYFRRVKLSKKLK
jgi:hypothetical protein